MRAATGRSAKVIAEYIGIYERARREFPAVPRLNELLDEQARRTKRGAVDERGPTHRLGPPVFTGYSEGGVSTAVVRMRARGEILPLRGYVADMGSWPTHKAAIVRLYLEGLTTHEIASRTYHSKRSVDRYIEGFERVRLLQSSTRERNCLSSPGYRRAWWPSTWPSSTSTDVAFSPAPSAPCQRHRRVVVKGGPGRLSGTAAQRRALDDRGHCSDDN